MSLTAFRVIPDAVFLFGGIMGDKRDRETRRRDEIREAAPDHKTDYDRIIAGEQEPEGQQKGWRNLSKDYNFAVIDREKHREISRKGAAAVNKMFGEKKTAKQALETILTLKVTDEIIEKAALDPAIAERLKRTNPDATIYDLIQAVAAGRAVGGNMKAYELIRDTYGDMPVKQVEITENITTEQDREMLRAITERLQAAETVQIVESISADPEDPTIKE